jgi:ureidoacrylate peracid hydrolase
MLRTLAEKVDPKHAVLVVIDMQNDYCHEDGSKAHDGADVRPVQTIVPALAGLVEGARAAGVPVLFTQAVHNPWTDSEVRRERHVDREPNCVEGTRGADFYGVLPTPADYIVKKARYSAFVGTDLELVLRQRGVRTVIVTGTATNTCVESTARDAFMRDFYVVAVEDACAQSNVRAHAASLEALEGTFGVVHPAADLLAAWGAPAPI